MAVLSKYYVSWTLFKGMPKLKEFSHLAMYLLLMSLSDKHVRWISAIVNVSK